MTINRHYMEQEFQSALLQSSKGDPYKLAKLLYSVVTVAPLSQSQAQSQFQQQQQQQQSSRTSTPVIVHDGFGTDWSNLVGIWLDALGASESGNAIKCYEHQATLHSQFNQLFATSSGNYLVPALHAVCRTTHRTAIASDRYQSTSSSNTHPQQQQQKQNDHTKLQNAVTLLQESFSRTYNDRKEIRPSSSFSNTTTNNNASPIVYDTESSKKVGVLGIVNFQLNTLRLCKNLVKPVEAKKLHIDSSDDSNSPVTATLGQLVTYRYYTGRLYLFEDMYQEAETSLQYAYDSIVLESNTTSASTSALSNLNTSSYHNRQCILRYLIPVKLYRGKLPTMELLEKYKLDEFRSLVSSIRKGDLKTFNNSLIDYQHRFIKQGTYLLLEKCKTVCYRNLFKRIHYVVSTTASTTSTTTSSSHQISLQQVGTVFHWLSMPIDLDEIECIVANLIYRGYIRGYISHSKRILVLSKRDPFPLSTVVATSSTTTSNNKA